MSGIGKYRTFDVEYTEPGIYRVNVSAFGETTSGREFRLIIPEFVFSLENIDAALLESVLDQEGLNDDPLSKGSSTGVNNKISQAEAAKMLEQQLAQNRIEFEEKEALKQQETLIAIVVANIIIIFVALLGYLTIRWRRKKLKMK